MIFPQKLQEKALAITGNVFMSTTTKFIRSSSQTANSNRRLVQTSQLPAHSQQKQIAKPDDGLISRKKQQAKTINSNDIRKNAHLSPANAVKGSQNKSQKSASEIAMHISASIFLNATTKFVKGFQTLGNTQKNKDQQKTQKKKSQSPPAKPTHQSVNVNVNIKPPINTLKKPLIQKKQMSVINSIPKTNPMPSSIIISPKPSSPPIQKSIQISSPTAKSINAKNPENIVVEKKSVSKEKKNEGSQIQTTKIVKRAEKQQQTSAKISPSHRIIARNQQNNLFQENTSKKKETSPKSDKKSETPRNPETNALHMAATIYLNSTTKFVKNIAISSQQLAKLNVSPGKREKSPVRQPVRPIVSPTSKSSIGLETKRNEQEKPSNNTIRNRFQSQTIKENANAGLISDGTKRIQRKRENARDIRFGEQKNQIPKQTVPLNKKLEQPKSTFTKSIEKEKQKQPSPQIKQKKQIDAKYHSTIPSPQKKDLDKNKYTYPTKTQPKTPKGKYIANFSNQQSQIGQNNAQIQGSLTDQKETTIQRKAVVPVPSSIKQKTQQTIATPKNAIENKKAQPQLSKNVATKNNQLSLSSKIPRPNLYESVGQISSPQKNQITNKATYKTVKVSKQVQNSKEQPIVSKQATSLLIKAKSDKNIAQSKELFDKNQLKKNQETKSVQQIKRPTYPPMNSIVKKNELPNTKEIVKTNNFKSVDAFERVWAQTTKPTTSITSKNIQNNEINATNTKSTNNQVQKANYIKNQQSELSKKKEKSDININQKPSASKIQKLDKQSKNYQQKQQQKQSIKQQVIKSSTQPIRSPYKRQPINKIQEKKEESKIQQKTIVPTKEVKKQQQNENKRKIIKRSNGATSPRQVLESQSNQKTNNVKFPPVNEASQSQKRETITSPNNRNIKTFNNRIQQDNNRIEDNSKNNISTINPAKVTPNNRLTATSLVQHPGKPSIQKGTYANQLIDNGNKNNINTVVSPIKPTPNSRLSSTSLSQPIGKPQNKSQNIGKHATEQKKQFKNEELRKTATEITNSQTQETSLKKILNIKRSSLLIYVIGKMLFNNKQFSFKKVEKRSKELKIKSKQSSILILQLSSFVANVISNNLKVSFHKLKKNLKEVCHGGKIVELDVTLNKERSANIIAKILSQKIRDHFTQIKQFSWIQKQLLQQILVNKQPQMNKGSPQKFQRCKQLLNFINILKTYNKSKLRAAFDKIYQYSFSRNSKQKPLTTSNLSNPAKKQIAPSRSPQKPQRNYQNQRNVLLQTKANLENQISKMQLSVGERKRSIDYERGKLIKKMQQLLKKVKHLESEVLKKRTRIKQLQGVVNTLQRCDFQIQLPQGQPLIQILTQMYTEVFKCQNEMIDKDKFMHLFSLNKDQCNSVIDVWKSLTRNIQLKAEIANWEGCEAKQHKMKQICIDEQKIQMLVVRSYIRERYLWEWVHESVQKL